MKNRFIVIYTIFAAAVFIFSMSFFGYNLFTEYTTNLKTSETRFTELVNDIRTISYAQDENTPSYAQQIKKAIGDAADYSFIQVRRNNETVVLYPTGKSKEETISRLTKQFNSNLNVNKHSVTVDCNLYLIRPDSIFYFSRISFLMILIITIITIIMIIYLNISESSSDVISLEENDAEETEEAETSETETVESKETPSEDSEEYTNEEIPDYYADTKFDEEEPETEEAETAEETVEEENHSEVTPEEVKAIFAEPLTDDQIAEEPVQEESAPSEPAKLPIDEITPAPAGLFDPATGIGWESYLLTRLDNEIDRATASEIDLSLFIIKLSNVDKTSEVFKNVCNYLTIQFQFKDLLFEYKEDCIVAIKISMGVDEALNLADKLFSDISNIIDNKTTRIGISSRSIRMVGGDRLILEAEQAIEHSDEHSPVIAFRVDSEKYRQMMEQNQA